MWLSSFLHVILQPNNTLYAEKNGWRFHMCMSVLLPKSWSWLKQVILLWTALTVTTHWTKIFNSVTDVTVRWDASDPESICLLSCLFHPDALLLLGASLIWENHLLLLKMAPCGQPKDYCAWEHMDRWKIAHTVSGSISPCHVKNELV